MSNDPVLVGTCRRVLQSYAHAVMVEQTFVTGRSVVLLESLDASTRSALTSAIVADALDAPLDGGTRYVTSACSV